MSRTVLWLMAAGAVVLSDDHWEAMSGLIIGRPDQCGSTGRDNRMFVEGVLWIVRTGSPWRDPRRWPRLRSRHRGRWPCLGLHPI
jgi:transposase